MPLSYLALHETLRHLRRPRVRLFVIAAAVLAIAVVSVGVGDYRLRVARYERAVMDREKSRHRTDLFLTGWTTEPALRAIRQPTPGSIFVSGVDAAIPAYWDFGPAGITAGPVEASMRHAGSSSLLDLEEVIRLVLGFLALTLSLETLAHERSTGRLLALMAHPVTPATVFAAKVLSALLTLACASAVVWAATAATMWVEARDLLSSEMLQALGALGVVSLLYLLVIFLGGLAVGGLVRTYEAALTVGIAAWFFVVLLAPHIVSVAANSLAVPDSIQAAESDRQTIYAGWLRLTERMLGTAAFDLRGGRAHDLDWKPDPETTRALDQLWQAQATEMRQMLDAVDERLATSVKTETRVRRWLSWMSPANLFMELASDLADTGPDAEARWQEDVGRQQRFLESKIFDDRSSVSMSVPNIDGGRELVSFKRHRTPLIRDIPDFTPSAQTLRMRISLGCELVVMLLSCGIVLASVAAWAFPRFGLQ